MRKTHPAMYEPLYKRLSSMTGMSEEEVKIFILKYTKVLTNDLHRNGEVYVPYLGKFSLKRLPARTRSVRHFGRNVQYTMIMPAGDVLKFKINREYTKLFK